MTSPTLTTTEIASFRPPNPKRELPLLRKKLKGSLVANGLDGPSRKFLPAPKVKTFVTQDIVRSVLPPDASPGLVHFVCTRAPKMFLSLVLGGEAEPHQLASVMRACQDQGMTDELLPIDEMLCIGDHSKCEKGHARALDIFHDKIWEDISFDFCHHQGTFLSPIFTREQFVYKEKDGCVLPFVRRSKAESDGHFSTVFEAWVHPDHHDQQITEEGSKELRVALKKLRHLASEPGYKVEEAWTHEVTALEKIRDLRHKNLIRPIAAVNRGSEYYIMFEWAEGGSLRTLWQSQGKEPKDLDADRVMIFIEEILGLAGALSTLHNTNTNTKTAIVVRRAGSLAEPGTSVRSQPVEPEIYNDSDDDDDTYADASSTPSVRRVPKIRFSLPSDDEDSRVSDDGSRSYYSDESDATGEEHWRHGDLKPENILQCFGANRDLSRWLGTLKIADVGLAKQHMFATRSRNEQTTMQYTTSHYEAPEANRYMNSSYHPRSRRFDVWSMGCVIFEFVIVILYGNKGLAAFYSERTFLDQTTETLYFTVHRDFGTAQVCDVVRHWIDEILKDPECRRPQSALREIIEFVRDRLLVVELPVDGMTKAEISRCRADAGELKEKLESIAQKARHDEQAGGHYLFATQKRVGLPIPPPKRGKKPRIAPTSSQYLGQGLQPRQKNLLETTWKFPVDNDFPLVLLKHPEFKASTPFPMRGDDQRLCQHCSKLDLLTPGVFVETLGSIQDASKKCDLHRLIYQACSSADTDHNAPVEIFRTGSNLFFQDGPSPLLSLCRSKDSATSEQNDPLNEIQIGFPTLLQQSSSAHLQLLSQWLSDCDTRHIVTCRPKNSTTSTDLPALPTRLIDVGSSKNSLSKVFLCVSKIIRRKSQSPDLRYIALSHPWGDAAKNKHFCTTKANFVSRLQKGIPMNDLPRTFQDAVHVTRALGIRYVWIDSLCILQGIDGDFHQEAKLMETVFSNAYCVIAASRATGTSSGFLSNQARNRKFVTLDHQLAHEEKLYVCEAINDFQSDVIDGPLNKRGWVLQERALARRTIYFTESQTYFECGSGVRCETLAKMTNNQAAFLGDPNFPDLTMTSTKGARIRIYESLYKTYSRLEFTKPYDRPIAIAGLEQRLVAAFNTHGGYGIFDGEFFGRSLLWKRDSEEGMRRIDFSAAQMLPLSSTKSYTVPTWSWMAYEGAISFLDLPFRGVEWHYGGEKGIKSPWAQTTTAVATGSSSGSQTNSSSATWHTGNSGEETYLKVWASEFVVSLEMAKTKILFDEGSNTSLGFDDWRQVKCVIVGRRKLKSAQQAGLDTGDLEHYVLVVVSSPKEGRQDMYERIGVAALPGSWIAQGGGEEEVRIF
ncbi:heterokaryon incompatibility protein-domain-containing protein [Cladorrhinum sp. PSN259]|nr:heterokaryon incompatibility protein-domain-containing protein [Cladorrhinum sp. PSN259]